MVARDTTSQISVRSLVGVVAVNKLGLWILNETITSIISAMLVI